MTNFKRYFCTFSAILLSWALLLVPDNADAQIPGLSADTAKATEAAPVWPTDSLGRRSPRGTVEGFLKAVGSQNYKNASRYLNLDSTLTSSQDSIKHAQSLQVLLETKGNIFPYSWISDQPSGTTDDSLGPDLDRIGVANLNGESFDLMLQKVKDKDGSPIWLFSSETFQRVPIDTNGKAIVPAPTLVEKLSPKVLEDNDWNGIPIAHWLAIVVLIAISYVLSVAITRAIVFVLPMVWKRARRESTAGIIQSFVLPIQLYLSVLIFVVGSRQAGISLIIRQRLNDVTLIVGLVALLLLIWQLLDFISRLVEKRLLQKGNHSGVSAVLFLRRAAKVAIVVLGVILILDTIGFDVTTWLTALGIGGIALALGTQKTVENFVGSVTLIADHPVRVGDFCRAGDIYGTIERIGMRTTQMRTNDRTIVSIPNGELSSTKIENFAPRDRMWFHPTFRLRLDTTTEQIKSLLVTLRRVMLEHPKVSNDPARVRFIEITSDAIKLEIFAYVSTDNFDEFLIVQEELLLAMMDVIKASGTGFAYPSQSLYVTDEKQPEVDSAPATGMQPKPSK